MKIAVLLFTVALTWPVAAQTTSPASDPWLAVRFLQGTWEAKTGGGSASAKVLGSYVFQKELKGHIVARHANVTGCKGPKDFDCEHSDFLYLYQDAPGQALKAIYLDNEGHVIHYDISTPEPTTAVFLSEAGPGPRFRLTYHLDGTLMSGKFQTLLPGHDDWTSYLEWSGVKQ